MVPFEDFGDTITFITECLDKHEHGKLLRTPEPSEGHAIVALARAHKAHDLRIIYKGRQFPKGGRRLKLGGHESILGHVHVDFERDDNGWFLKRIWQCR